jgi:hypothetical protein
VRTVSDGIRICTGGARNGCASKRASAQTMSCTSCVLRSRATTEEKSRGSRRLRTPSAPPAAALNAATPVSWFAGERTDARVLSMRIAHDERPIGVRTSDDVHDRVGVASNHAHANIGPPRPCLGQLADPADPAGNRIGEAIGRVQRARRARPAPRRAPRRRRAARRCRRPPPSHGDRFRPTTRLPTRPRSPRLRRPDHHPRDGAPAAPPRAPSPALGRFGRSSRPLPSSSSLRRAPPQVVRGFRPRSPWKMFGRIASASGTIRALHARMVHVAASDCVRTRAAIFDDACSSSPRGVTTYAAFNNDRNAGCRRRGNRRTENER